MKRFTFNKQFMVLMFLLLNCFASYATSEDLITKQITIKLTEAGTLPNKIASNKKNLVTNLKIIGEINGTDLRFIRGMAGCDTKGDSIFGNLSILDLSEARIVEGGDYYVYINDAEPNKRYNYTHDDILGYYTFYRCWSLTSVKIPKSVKIIEEGAFYCCTSLTNVNIPSSVTEIDEWGFSDCISLTSVFIPSSVKKIKEGAFNQCISLKNIHLSSGLELIGRIAFLECTSLTTLNIPSSVTEIGEAVFYECNNLKSIYVFAEDVPSIDTDAFKGCDSKNCIVYVPKGTNDAYWLSEFGYFENIIEFDATSIHNTIATSEVQETARYAVNGQRLTAPIKGINLVKYSDGTVKKEFVK